ncbi:MAG: PLP-dependent aminotransferase family protein, partial [Oscillospiraceae bacterium]
MNVQFADRMGNLHASAIREILKFTQDPTVISFAAGNPAPEAFPTKEIARISNEILTKNPIAALQYSISEGYTPFRNALKKEYKERNHYHDRDELIIVSGAQQGMELACKVLCNPGDTVICEKPSFVGSLNAFKSFEVNLVGVDMEDDGISIEGLEKALKENKNTKFIYLIPNFQNPSGITMSFEKRKAVYLLAVKYDVLIVEDNPYGELRFAGTDVPNIKTIDTEDIVIYCGSFSKIMSPGMRVGFVIAKNEIIQKIVVVKQTSDVHTNIWSQMICEQFMRECDMKKHIAGLKKIYQHKAQLMLDGIKQHFSPAVKYTVPAGGLFIWCTLPEGV